MKFAREKRLLVGWLALLLPLPLPLNQVLEWPVLFVYAGFVVYFLQRVEDGRPIVLSNTALNLLGFLYLPVLAIDLRQSLLRDQVVRALLHLLLFLLVVKLYSMKQENEKWHILSAIFFLFVAAMATSSHMTVILYLVGAAALCLYGLARLAHLSMLAAVGRAVSREKEKEPAKEPVRATPLPRISWAGWVSLLLIIALAIPVFAAMPRLRKPWVLGRGAGQIGLARTTGFSDQVNLSSLTSGIRENREVVLRIGVETGSWPDAGDLRLKGASFETYDNAENRWSRSYGEFRALEADAEGVVRLEPEGEGPDVVGRWQVSLEPIDSPSLVLPMETVAVDVGPGSVRALGWGPGGDFAHRGLAQRGQAVNYDVLVSRQVVIAAHDGTDGLDASAASPRVRELARQVMGEGSAFERSRRLERWLINEIDYTTDFAGREGRRPIEEFLFEHRSGHCELFATSMVLMLRSEGIPSRLVTGFLGAEVNNLEDQLVVRASNAHAWVEALTEDGWQVFDPTPPAGRPTAPDRGLFLLAIQIYDFVVYRFDRYILTYGSDDQESIIEAMKTRLAELWNRFWPEEPDPDLAPDTVLTTVVAGEPTQGFALWTSPKVRLGGLLIFAALVTALWLWRRRPLRAVEAYERLRSTLEEQGFGVDEATAPLELRRRLAIEIPAAAEPGGRLVDLYLDASYGEKPLQREIRDQLRDLLATTVKLAGSEAKRRRREARKRH
ncbi:MAG: DUF3488 and transglutaminase-like domain-containing protein [Thermoanaerobaculia bacterium]|nr:DUF3488 and transglutaminase-like domain-containing protein [Thermoanaerobaculia bacterium]